MTVFHVLLSHDESNLFSASSDQTVIIWDTKKEKKKAVLKGHTGSVYTLKQSKNSDFLFSGSYDNSIIKWNLKTLEINDVFHGFYTYLTSMSFSSNERLLYSIDSENSNFIRYFLFFLHLNFNYQNLWSWKKNWKRKNPRKLQ